MTNFVDLSRPFGDAWDGMWEDFLARLTTTTDALEGIAGASATSAALALGAKVFAVIPPNRVYPVGVPLRLVATANGAASLTGAVTASTPGSVTINVTGFTGAGGPYDTWAIIFGGPPGPSGLDAEEITALVLCL